MTDQASAATDYDASFYNAIQDGSRRSACAIVPYVRRLLPNVKSVVDFGCGSGAWLAEFERSGLKTIQGLDFGVGVAAQLSIRPENYRSANLGAPISVGGYDLSVSLEVAEHLASDCAETFVDNLVNAAPRILFAAAITNQGGHHHVNEQPPDYWISKFRRRGFECLDVIRPIVWHDSRVCWWYRQNIILLMHSTLVEEIRALLPCPSFHGSYIVHPDCFQQFHRQFVMNAGLR